MNYEIAVPCITTGIIKMGIDVGEGKKWRQGNCIMHILICVVVIKANTHKCFELISFSFVACLAASRWVRFCQLSFVGLLACVSRWLAGLLLAISTDVCMYCMLDEWIGLKSPYVLFFSPLVPATERISFQIAARLGSRSVRPL